MNDPIEQAAEVIEQHTIVRHDEVDGLVWFSCEDCGALPEGTVMNHPAQALADAGLLPTEVEHAATDMFGQPELWRGVFATREEAEAAADPCCTEGPVYRYVGSWQEVSGNDDT